MFIRYIEIGLDSEEFLFTKINHRFLFLHAAELGGQFWFLASNSNNLLTGTHHESTATLSLVISLLPMTEGSSKLVLLVPAVPDPLVPVQSLKLVLQTGLQPREVRQLLLEIDLALGLETGPEVEHRPAVGPAVGAEDGVVGALVVNVLVGVLLRVRHGQGRGDGEEGAEEGDVELCG